MNDDLRGVCQLFMTAIPILVLGLTGGTEGLKTGISTAGLLVAVAWAFCGYKLSTGAAVDRVLVSLSGVALLGWLVALSIHLPKWWRGE